MNSDCKKIREIVLLWYETQRGHYRKCREKNIEFADVMWELYEELEQKKDLKLPEYQSL